MIDPKLSRTTSTPLETRLAAPKPRPLGRAGVLVSLLALAAGAGCHAAAAASPPDTSQLAARETSQEAAPPFASPPVLPGTPDIATLVAKVKPSVVNITTVQEVRAPRGDLGFPGGLEKLFPFFRQGPNGLPRGGGGEGDDQVMKQQALGSGFLVDASGHV